MSRPISTRHGSDPTTRWLTGVFPKCKCGFNPRNNERLQEHYRAFGFEEIDDHGTLVQRPIPRGEPDGSEG